MSFVDPDGEFPWLAAIVVGVFTYLSNAKSNTPSGKSSGNPSNWSWNPGNWNSVYVANVGYNTGGDWTFSGGVGPMYGPVPVYGYNTQYGPGIGVSNNGSTSMYYPGYENRVNNSIERNANTAINNARQVYVDNTWTALKHYLSWRWISCLYWR